jgi:hypothetical protein
MKNVEYCVVLSIFWRNNIMENKYLNFWNWFEQNSELIFSFEADAENIFTLLENELGKVDENLTFEFGPIENNKREFIISADGIKDSFNEVENLYDQKPELENWIIIKFRQRKDMSQLELKINGITYYPKDIYFRLFNDDAKIGILTFVKDYSEELHGNMVFYCLIWHSENMIWKPKWEHLNF